MMMYVFPIAFPTARDDICRYISKVTMQHMCFYLNYDTANSHTGATAQGKLFYSINCICSISFYSISSRVDSHAI